MFLLKRILPLFFAVYIANAANLDYADSMRSVIKNAPERAKPAELLKLASYYQNSRFDKAIELSRRACSISQKFGIDSTAAAAFLTIGYVYYSRNQYDSSRYYYDSALKIFRKNKDSIGISNCYNNLGLLSKNRGEYKNALEYYFKSLSMREAAGDSASIAASLNNIGTVYYYMRDNKNALKYYKNALAIKEKIAGEQKLSSTLNNLGMIFSDMGKSKQALKYYRRSLELDEKYGNEKGVSTALNNIGNVYLDMKDYDKAIEYYSKAIELDRKLGNPFGYTLATINTGCAYHELNQYDKAVSLLKKGAGFAEENGFIDVLKETYYITHQVYKDAGDYANALSYYKKYTAIKDSLFNEKMRSSIAEFRVKYESEKKQKEIALLKKENEIRQKENKILKRSETMNNVLHFALAGALIFAAAIIILLYMRYKDKKRSHDLLEESRREMAEDARKLVLLNDKLADSETRLTETVAAKDKFFSIIAHDLKNPLAALITSSDLLSLYFGKMDEATLKANIVKMNLTAKNLKELLENLLQWARTQTDRIEFSPEPLNLREIVESCERSLKAQAQSKNVKIINKIDENLVLEADRNMLEAIARNLISNAIKFSYEGGEIIVEARENESDVELKVKDFGAGISQSDLDKLFRIEHIHTTAGTKNEKGVGLGLVLCKEFAEKHGGSIKADGKTGSGAEFTVSTPKIQKTSVNKE